MMINVAFAEDHVAVRKAIINFVETKNPEVSVVIESNDGIQLMQKLKYAQQLPDICMLDINMPNMDGLTVMVEIKRNWPQMKFLILTAFNDENMILRMIKAGANGYLLKNCDADEIGQALQNIQQTGYHYSNAASSKIFNMVHNRNVKIQQQFTTGELELLKYSTSNLSFAEIAEKMSTSTSSVEGYRSRLYSKLNIASRVELALFAFQSGLMPAETDKTKN